MLGLQAARLRPIRGDPGSSVWGLSSFTSTSLRGWQKTLNARQTNPLMNSRLDVDQDVRCFIQSGLRSS